MIGTFVNKDCVWEWCARKKRYRLPAHHGMTQLSTQETTTDNNFMQVSQLPLGVQAFLAATAAFAVVLEEEKEEEEQEETPLKERVNKTVMKLSVFAH